VTELLLGVGLGAWLVVCGRYLFMLRQGHKVCDGLDAVADALDALPATPCACGPAGCRDHHADHRRFGLLVARARAADGFGVHRITGAVRPGALAELAALARRAEELRGRVERSRLTAEAVAALGVEMDADAADLDRLAGSLTPAGAAALAGTLQLVRAAQARTAAALEERRSAVARAATARTDDPVGRPRPVPRRAHYRRRLSAVHHADDPDAARRCSRGLSPVTFATFGGIT